MNDISIGQSGEAPATREEIISALFAHMVIQQTNMAMMLLGEVPHPQTGQHMLDLESAKMFIDQLEMIEAKTKGNLDHEEESLLKQALAALRMSFVKAVDKAPPQESAAPPASDPAAKSAPAPAAAQVSSPETKSTTTPAPETPPPAADDSRKKFSKKY